jgi:uncharacterized protein
MKTASSSTVSAAAARRMALAAQGFNRAKPTGRVDRRHVRRLFEELSLIQIDSVNVLVRSQELPLFARLGSHDRSLLPSMTDDGELFEAWAHEASHLPVALHPLLRWRTASAAEHVWPGIRELSKAQPTFVAKVLDTVRERGAVVAGDMKTRTGPKGSWWDWDHGKLALEWLFRSGQLAARRRANDFARVYDIPERMIPADVLAAPTPSRRDAHKELLVRSARSHGIGTAKDLIDYFRLNSPEATPLLAELVEEGRLLQVTVDGWSKPAFAHPDAAKPRRVDTRALLSPFDPIVWERDRAERIFGFRYRIEIYVPQPKRVYGYYVLPFLLGDELVGRVDLKADRAAGSLLVQSAWHEPGHETPDVAEELAAELASMATWLGLDRVVVTGRGDLGPLLKRVTFPPARSLS